MHYRRERQFLSRGHFGYNSDTNAQESDNSERSITSSAPPTQQHTELDVAWLAGFFEGEGTVNRHDLRIPQVQRWPLDRVRELFGGCVGGPYNWTPTDGGPRRDFYLWRVTGHLALEILNEIYPWLSPKRQAQAQPFLKVSRLSDAEKHPAPTRELLRRLAPRR